jgi:hypothetical protein
VDVLAGGIAPFDLRTTAWAKAALKGNICSILLHAR